MSVKKHIPNTITCLNLISGCIATCWAFQGSYAVALGFIVAGAVFDFFDGMTARLLGVSSPIGKELDSLADVVTFGFAPSAMAYAFLRDFFAPLASPLPLLPYLAFVMAAFSALRLAKFNLDERQALGFIGLPTPANALFWGALIVWLHLRLMSEPYALPTFVYYVLVGLIFVSSWLLVCEMPMFALKFKQWGWRGNEVKYVYVGTAVLLIVLLGIPGIATAIAWYVVLSAVLQLRDRK